MAIRRSVFLFSKRYLANIGVRGVTAGPPKVARGFRLLCIAGQHPVPILQSYSMSEGFTELRRGFPRAAEQAFALHLISLRSISHPSL